MSKSMFLEDGITKKYEDLAKVRVTKERELIISKINKPYVQNDYNIKELQTIKESDGRVNKRLLPFTIEFASLAELVHLRDALTSVILRETQGEDSEAEYFDDDIVDEALEAEYFDNYTAAVESNNENYNLYTVDELKMICKQQGIKGVSKAKKADIIKKIMENK